MIRSGPGGILSWRRGGMLPGGRALRRARRRAGRGGLPLARMIARLMMGAAMAEGRSQKARVGSRSHSGRCGPLST